MQNEQSGIDKVLSELKDFQRDTVEHVTKRFYGKNGTRRFLVADEVGLGKTHVARGVVAKTLEHLKKYDKRIDIIYICSNVAIAKQNANRLFVPEHNENGNPNGHRENNIELTRLTLLPLQLDSLNKKSVKYISLTPNTALNFEKFSTGIVQERAFIFKLLENMQELKNKKFKGTRFSTCLQYILQCNTKWENWQGSIEKICIEQIDRNIIKCYHQSIYEESGLIDEIIVNCPTFYQYEKYREFAPDKKRDCLKLVQNLRRVLAKVSLQILNPKLIILDEFQKYNNLLEIKSNKKLEYTKEATNSISVAQILFNETDSKILLLSATPYKMYNLGLESEGEDTYKEFIDMLTFLFQKPKKVEEVKSLLSKYRKVLESWVKGEYQNQQVKDDLQDNLLKVMCRTERINFTESGNAMVKPSPRFRNLNPSPDELEHIFYLDEIARLVGGGDQIEYWKSVPFVLNFMKDYELRKKMQKHLNSKSKDLKCLLDSLKNHLLKFSDINSYRPINNLNARMDTLLDESVKKNMWKLLWLPPSMPYIEPYGEFKNTDVIKNTENSTNLSKSLIFSNWQAIPSAIATICSHEAERNMIKKKKSGVTRDNLGKKVFKPRLVIRARTDKSKIPKTSLPVLSLLYPSPTLAFSIDPLKIVLDNGGEPMNHQEIQNEVTKMCRRLTKSWSAEKKARTEDSRWYWIAPLLIDKQNGILNWLRDPRTRKVLDTTRIDSESDSVDTGIGINDQFDLLTSVIENNIQLGPKPKNLNKVLTDFALGGPGICALRALKRIAPDLENTDSTLLNAALTIAFGFQSLYNLPMTIAMLQKREKYWRTILKYGISGNIQSLLDEYVHTLSDSLSPQYQTSQKLVNAIGKHIRSVLSQKGTYLSVDEIKKTRSYYEVNSGNIKINCHFAQRFGGIQDKTEVRNIKADSVREAFNSPFRPFILASTSIGQEGLDFHTWCHSVMHWNLPSNPVNLEQREGRVHRYKGHAVRKNIADKYGLSYLKQKLSEIEGDFFNKDPWELQFNEASKNKSGDLKTYWVFEDGSAKIERQIPLLSYSKEDSKFERLKLSLVLYRLVFGQPRQQDLLDYLRKKYKTEDDVVLEEIKKLQISLKPDKFEN